MKFKKLLPFALLLVPLLVGCPELNGKPSPSPSSSPVTLTAKQKTIGGCNNNNQCVPNVYTLYYTDGSYSEVDQTTHDNAKLGDRK
jgi:hypothetical protein